MRYSLTIISYQNLKENYNYFNKYNEYAILDSNETAGSIISLTL